MYTDDPGIVSRSPLGLEGMMAVIVTACVRGVWACGIGGRDGDHVPANERRGEAPITVTAAGQVQKQRDEFMYLSGAISANRDFSVEIAHQIQREWA